MTKRTGNIQLPELLAPAGDFETLHTAIEAGADAVYFGVGDMNMRASAARNFSIEDLPEIAKLCKDNNVNSYITINTLLYNDELDYMKNLVDRVKEVGLSAIIAADMATILYARKQDQEVHISTQLSISNIESLKFYSQFADRVVLARELSLKQQKEIAAQVKEQNITGPRGELIELEVFAHGALCVAVSGRCSMSLYCYDRSANRGKCTHICRRAYKVTDLETGQELKIDNNYVMSASDLCTIGMLEKLVDAGASVLKIEGRGRTPDYVHTVTSTYKEALQKVGTKDYNEENIMKWNKKLGTVFNRGFSTGLYMGRKFDEWSKGDGNKATKTRFQVGKIRNYFHKQKVAEFMVEGDTMIKVGDEFNITGPTTGLVQGTIEEMRIDDQEIKSAKQGDIVTIPLEKKVRRSDMLFVMRKAKD